MIRAGRLASTIGVDGATGDMVLRCPRSRLAGLVPFALAGCVASTSSIGDPLATTESTTTSDSVTTTDDGANVDPSMAESSTSVDESTSTGAAPLTCPEWSTCTVPMICSEFDESCEGALDSNLDEGGCPRQPCEAPGDCPDGYACYRASDWNRCGPHPCQEFEPGVCECGFGLDCNQDAICVPAEIAPPEGTTGVALCGSFTDADACNTGFAYSDGHCRWYEGWQVPVDQTCAESLPFGECTFVRTLAEPAEGPACAGAPELLTYAWLEDEVLTVVLVDGTEPPQNSYTSCEILGVDELCACGCP
jgi:hypothetical protein